MTQPDEDNVTMLLDAVASGRENAWEELLAVVYDELRGIARSRLKGLQSGQTLQATALVHEAYLRLVKSDLSSWKSRSYFFGAAARSMRNILVDAARRKSRQKRGGDWDRVTLHGQSGSEALSSADLLTLNDALEKLAELDVRQHDVVMLRYFAGLSDDEVAAALEVSTSTVERLWSFARAWLHRELKS